MTTSTSNIIKKFGYDLNVGDHILFNGSHVYSVAEECGPSDDHNKNPTKGVLNLVPGISKSLQSTITAWSNIQYTVISESSVASVKIQNRHKGNYRPSSVSKGMSTTGDFVAVQETIRTGVPVSDFVPEMQPTPVVETSPAVSTDEPKVSNGDSRTALANAKAKISIPKK